MTIDKITIAVGLMEKMVTFYSDVLEVAFRPQDMFGSTLFTAQFGEIEIMLCPKEIAGVDANVNTVQLRFVVADVRRSFNAAAALDAVVLSPPQKIDNRLAAAVRDPDGNSLELAAAADI